MCQSVRLSAYIILYTEGQTWSDSGKGKAGVSDKLSH